MEVIGIYPNGIDYTVVIEDSAKKKAYISN